MPANQGTKHDLAIVRPEQLAPLPRRRLRETLDARSGSFFWVQRGTSNQVRGRDSGSTTELLPDKLAGIRSESRAGRCRPVVRLVEELHAVEQRRSSTRAFG